MALAAAALIQSRQTVCAVPAARKHTYTDTPNDTCAWLVWHVHCVYRIYADMYASQSVT